MAQQGVAINREVRPERQWIGLHEVQFLRHTEVTRVATSPQRSELREDRGTRYANDPILGQGTSTGFKHAKAPQAGWGAFEIGQGRQSVLHHRRPESGRHRASGVPHSGGVAGLPLR